MRAPAPRVARLWRYPVKSMGGEPCRVLRLERRGVAHDRVFAVRSEGGKLGSGKSTRRFCRIEGLLRFRSILSGGIPEVVFPDGRRFHADDPGVDEALSRALGRPVTVTREETVSHLDAAPVHLLTTASLDWLRAALPGSVLQEERFRPNVVIELPGDEPVERGWIGRNVRVGEAVELRVVSATQRCRMVGLAQGNLPDDEAILQHLARHSDARLGVYAEVVTPGRIGLRDTIEVLPG